MKSYKKKKGNHRLTSNMDDCNFNHYSLQLSLYRYILETYYSLEVSDHLIVHLMENGTKVYHTPYMKDDIVAMINNDKDIERIEKSTINRD